MLWRTSRKQKPAFWSQTFRTMGGPLGTFKDPYLSNLLVLSWKRVSDSQNGPHADSQGRVCIGVIFFYFLPCLLGRFCSLVSLIWDWVGRSEALDCQVHLKTTLFLLPQPKLQLCKVQSCSSPDSTDTLLISLLLFQKQNLPARYTASDLRRTNFFLYRKYIKYESI